MKNLTKTPSDASRELWCLLGHCGALPSAVSGGALSSELSEEAA